MYTESGTLGHHLRCSDLPTAHAPRAKKEGLKNGTPRQPRRAASFCRRVSGGVPQQVVTAKADSESPQPALKSPGSRAARSTRPSSTPAPWARCSRGSRWRAATHTTLKRDVPAAARAIRRRERGAGPQNAARRWALAGETKIALAAEREAALRCGLRAVESPRKPSGLGRHALCGALDALSPRGGAADDFNRARRRLLQSSRSTQHLQVDTGSSVCTPLRPVDSPGSRADAS